MMCVAGCSATAALRGQIQGTREIIARAEQHGARNCAPRELATALANLEFAEVELDQGDRQRAEAHVALAEPNARAALRMSPPERCLAQETPPPALGDRDGDGVLDAADRCPDEPEDRDGFEDDDGCPEEQDTDGDTILDASDFCVFQPEDRDGYLDEDGCPEPDDDLDGIADDEDRCPRDPEDRDGFEDDDGCPEADNDRDGVADVMDRCPNEAGIESEQGCPRTYVDVEVTDEGIIIHQQVFFETDRAVIRSVSFPLLDTVAQVLRDFPEIMVEVQGHTDSRGRDSHNLRLSQARAESVREYLIRVGIAPERLSAHGYGETQPIETNATPEGRTANRRVEFRRTDTVRARTP